MSIWCRHQDLDVGADLETIRLSSHRLEAAVSDARHGASRRASELPDKLPFHYSAPTPNRAIAEAALVSLAIECVDPAISGAGHCYRAPITSRRAERTMRRGLSPKGGLAASRRHSRRRRCPIYGAGFNHDRADQAGVGSTLQCGYGVRHERTRPAPVHRQLQAQCRVRQTDLVSLIHSIFGGRRKDRLTRAATYQRSPAVHCFPIITGEDGTTNPRRSPASYSLRLNGRLVANQKLAAAQMSSGAVGHHACGADSGDLLRGEGSRSSKETAKFLPAVRDNWAGTLQASARIWSAFCA